MASPSRRVGIDIRGPRGVMRIDYLWRDDPRAFAPLPDYPHDQREFGGPCPPILMYPFQTCAVAPT